jgi:hypothetical protein
MAGAVAPLPMMAGAAASLQGFAIMATRCAKQLGFLRPSGQASVLRSRAQAELLSAFRKLGKPVIIRSVNAGLERGAASSGAAVACNDPVPLDGVDGSIPPAPGLLVEDRHAPVLPGQHWSTTDGVLDRGSCRAAVKARTNSREATRRPDLRHFRRGGPPDPRRRWMTNS